MTTLKTCSRCGRELPATTAHFWGDPTKPGGLANPCIDCRKAARIKFRAENPERVRAWNDRRNQYKREKRALARAARPPRQPKVKLPKPPRQVKQARPLPEIKIELPDTTIGRLMAAYIAAKRLSWKRKTLTHAARLLPALAAHVGDKWPVSWSDLTSFFETTTGNATTIRTYFAYLAGFFSFLEVTDEIRPKDNPARQIKKLKLLPRKPTPAPKATDPAALARILAYLEGQAAESGELATLRDLAIIKLLYATGMRAGELVRLTRADLDIEKHEAVLRETKSGKYRIVFFDEAAARALTSYVTALEVAIPGGQVLFPALSQRSWGARMQTNGISQLWRRAARAAGIEDPGGIHGLRHRHALDALEAGISIRALQRQLGHSSIEVTANYLTLTDSDRRDAYATKWH